jgi:hypothetical protein
VTAPSTISDAIRVRATLDPQRPAIVSTDLPTLTFGELDCTIRQIGDELKNAKRMDYEPSTWRRLARVVHDRGDHNTCVTTFAGVVANELQRILAGRRMQ